MELSLKQYIEKYGKDATIAELVKGGMEQAKAMAMVEAELKTKEPEDSLVITPESDKSIDDLKKEMKTMEERIKEYIEKPLEEKIPDGAKEPTSGFKSFGEQAFEVAKFRSTGKMDKRLEPFYVEKAAGTGPDTLSGPGGAFLVAPEYMTSILGMIPQASPIVAKTRVMPIAGGNVIKIPAMHSSDESGKEFFDGIKVYRRAEKTQLTASAPEWAMIELHCEELIGFTAVTLEMINRTPQSLDVYLRQMFTYAMARTLEHEIIQGIGAGGQFLGLINSPAVVAQAVETGQTSADVLVARNLTKMLEDLAPECSSPCWIFHPKMRTHARYAPEFIGAGGELYKGYDPRTGTMEGFPIYPSFSCKTPNTTGDIILTDLSFYIRAVESGMDRWDMSEHFLFDYVQNAFRMIMSNDGQSWWKSSRLEIDGTSETSPVVTLATRS